MNEIIDLRTNIDANIELNKNKQITDYLKEAIEHIKAESALTADPNKKKTNPYRIRSLQKGIDVLTAHPTVITSGSEAIKLPGIGKGIAARIDEILTTGKLDELNSINDKLVRVIKELTKIHGIGPVKAQKLIADHQISSLQDLIEKYQAGSIPLGKNQLTHAQVIGIKYAHDLETKIPRAEMDQFQQILLEVTKSIELQMEICGSYRRGKLISGDIDVLISPSVNQPDCLNKLVDKLTVRGILVDHLTHEGHTKYMGIARLSPDSPARRIDIRVIQRQQWPAALLYFTGSSNFNQMFRAIALQRGFTVNEYAICRLENVDGLLVKGPPLEVHSEQDIFDIVGVKYLTPAEREF
jgi:DNA polymerase/3'-5' exonuclease PolX